MKKNKKLKILTINFGGIGDEILFFPTLKTIKSEFPNSDITIALEPRSKSAKDLTNLIDAVITCDIKRGNKAVNLLKLLTEIWTKRFDMVISSGSSKFISIILFLTGIKKRYGYDSGPLSRLLLTNAIPLNKNQYAVDMYHDLTSAISNKKAELPEVNISEEDLLKATELVGEKSKKIILIHPGVSKMSIDKKIIKFWTVQRWTELIIKLLNTDKYKVILTGGPDDEESVLRIRKELENQEYNKENFIDAYGKTKNITQLAALTKLSNLLVCVDSAPMHIGVGVKTPLVAIFGPTDENKLIPMNDSRFLAVKNDSVNCRPCLWEKRQISCEETECLDISVEQVLEAVIAKL